MERQERIREKANKPDLTFTHAGPYLVIKIDGREITFRAMATDEQILAEIAKIRRITESPAMSITGANYLAGSIKERIAAAKAKVGEVTANADTALAKLNSAADAADQVNKAIEAEADSLLAEIGQVSNGGPA